MFNYVSFRYMKMQNQRHADTYLLLLGPPQPQPQPQPQPSLPRSPASSGRRLRDATWPWLRCICSAHRGVCRSLPLSARPSLSFRCRVHKAVLCVCISISAPADRSISAVLLVHMYAFASGSRSSLSGGLTLLPSEFSPLQVFCGCQRTSSHFSCSVIAKQHTPFHAMVVGAVPKFNFRVLCC